MSLRPTTLAQDPVQINGRSMVTKVQFYSRVYDFEHKAMAEHYIFLCTQQGVHGELKLVYHPMHKIWRVSHLVRTLEAQVSPEVEPQGEKEC